MIKNERKINLIIGSNILFFAFLGLTKIFIEGSVPVVKICTIGITILASVLIMNRKKAIISYKLFSKPYWLLAFICNMMIFKFSQPIILWSIMAKTVFIIGTSITFVSLLHLGKSFSIVPSLRAIVSKGVYRVIRHPAYLGETIMSFACFISNPSILLLLLFLILLYAQLLRIRVEEIILSNSVSYQQYTRKVRWKFIPFIW